VCGRYEKFYELELNGMVTAVEKRDPFPEVLVVRETSSDGIQG
jgi:hypothetical protein